MVRTLGFQSSNPGSTPGSATMHPKYQSVIKLRKRGKSYREIAQIAGVSKNSVSRWCKSLKLSPVAQKIIEAKTKATRIQLAAYSQRKHQLVQVENKKIRRDAAAQIHSLSRYELLLIGVALHWGEGNKKELGRIQFVNSDPYMIALYLHFLRKVLQVPEEKFYVSIRIHPNINKQSTIKFWSKITNIPQERFHITRQISRLSRGKRPRNSLPYGTLDLRTCSRQKFQQIKGWIDGLIKQNI